MNRPYIKPTASTLSLCAEGCLAVSSFDVDSEQSGSQVLSKRKGWSSEDWVDLDHVEESRR